MHFVELSSKNGFLSTKRKNCFAESFCDDVMDATLSSMDVLLGWMACFALLWRYMEHLPVLYVYRIFDHNLLYLHLID